MLPVEDGFRKYDSDSDNWCMSAATPRSGADLQFRSEVTMNLKDKLKSLLQQGSLYRTQGLLTEAKSKYEEAIKLLETHKQVKNREGLIAGIREKIRGTETDLEKFEEAPETPEISAKIQDLIQSQFAFSDDDDKAALEGAIALAKFGQFKRALEEFEKLIDRDAIRVDAAKNIVRCHMALSSLEEAIEQYGQWLAQDRFKSDQLDKVRVFFEATLERAGVDRELPQPTPPEAGDTAAEETQDLGEPTIEMPEIETEIEILEQEETTDQIVEIEVPEVEDDEILDINSIGFTPESGPKQGTMVELNVSFQSGDVISILIPGRDIQIIDYLTLDLILDNAQFYSPIAIFNGTGKVIAKTKIESGPRRGDYNVDIKVVST